MAGIVFLIDAAGFVIVVLWAFEAERGGSRRGLLDMIGSTVKSAARSAPRWARGARLAPGARLRRAPGWRRSLGRIRSPD